MAGLMEYPQRLLSVILTMVVLIAGAAHFGGVAAQSPGCATSLATLYPCMGYITSNISSSSPSQGCCTALSSLVQGSVMCLCQLFSAMNPMGIPINQTRTLALPGSCNLATPPLSQCNVAGVPAASAPTGSSAPPATETSPSSSPATPNAEPPSSNLPSLNPPTTSVRGIPPPATKNSTSNAGTLFTPSVIISALTVAMVAISIY